jgi:peroxiredoxin (alkyl hydroperoxide reductase subunit C)
MPFTSRFFLTLLLILAVSVTPAMAGSETAMTDLYDPGKLKPIDSRLKVKTGQPAPDFTLPSVSGKNITLSQYRGKKNVVLSFVPAAWTPVCSNQWPGYNLQQNMFEKGDAVLLGISVDNIPTLYAWTRRMGHLWFEVLSDFWPHGAVTAKYGLLRSDGMSDRALIFIDKQGIIRTTLVTDINKLPNPKTCALRLKELNEK